MCCRDPAEEAVIVAFLSGFWERCCVSEQGMLVNVVVELDCFWDGKDERDLSLSLFRLHSHGLRRYALILPIVRYDIRNRATSLVVPSKLLSWQCSF